MPHSTTRRPSRRPSGGARVFSDDLGRLWTASKTLSGAREGAIQFTCIGDAREAVRVIAVDEGAVLAEVSDDTLRDWLRVAPRLGTLT